VPRPTSDERRDVGILAVNQALFLVAAITVMTLGGIVGQRLAPTPTLATLSRAGLRLGGLTLATAVPRGWCDPGPTVLGAPRRQYAEHC
jgi:hypothetical protein